MSLSMKDALEKLLTAGPSSPGVPGSPCDRDKKKQPIKT